MKKLLLTAIFISMVAIFAPTVLAQGFPYHLYDTRTVFELNELNLSLIDPSIKTETQLMISAKPFYSAIRFEYMGESRKIPENKKGLFKLWVESLNIKGTNTDRKVEELIDREYLFRECDQTYWIPAQTPTAKDFPDNFEKGDRITLYLMMVGGIRIDNGDWDFVYLINSFKNVQAPNILKIFNSDKKSAAAPEGR